MGMLFDGMTQLRARAHLLGERLDTRALEGQASLAQSPQVLPVDGPGCAVVFRYGAVVLFGVSDEAERAFLASLAPLVEDALPRPELEEIEIGVTSGPPDGGKSRVFQVGDLAIERIQLIAETLAQSVALSRYEAVVREAFALTEGWAQRIEETGSLRTLESKLKRHLGRTLLIQHSMAGRIEIGDKPDLLWERPDLERLWARLVDEYELRERERTLERKLALMTQTAELLLNMVATKHSNRLEWYIIGLIAFEIGLSLVVMLRNVVVG
jgi:uncharacterized Rmd1/YagE family protein